MTISRVRAVLFAAALLAGGAACDNGDDGGEPADQATTTSSTSGTDDTDAGGNVATVCDPQGDTEPKDEPAEGGLVFVTSVTAGVTDPPCVEQVAFGLEEPGEPGTRLGYEIGYAEGPFADVSGAEADVEGEAFLRIVLHNGTTADLSGEEPRITFDEEPALADDLALITDVVQVSDFEGVSEWVIGLTAELPFDVGGATAEAESVLSINIYAAERQSS